MNDNHIITTRSLCESASSIGGMAGLKGLSPNGVKTAEGEPDLFLTGSQHANTLALMETPRFSVSGFLVYLLS